MPMYSHDEFFGIFVGPHRASSHFCLEAAVYTVFMEDSTRTKESFRNAAEFHGLKVNVFDAKTSSFQMHSGRRLLWKEYIYILKDICI